MREHSPHQDHVTRESTPADAPAREPLAESGLARRAQAHALAEFDEDGEDVEVVGEPELSEDETPDAGGDAGADADAADGAEEAGDEVTLALASATIDLTETYTLTATAPGEVSTYTFEYRAATATDWTTIQTGASATCTGTARIAGQFKVRVTADGVSSEEVDATVRFPAYADIVADGTVSAACDAAWTQTKNATTETTRREQAFWVRLDTAGEGTYSVTATIIGPTRNNNQGASVQPLPKPADTVNGDSRVYTVACFHTHTPMTHRFHPDYDAATGSPMWSRPVGPSGGDLTFHNHASVRVPGIAYDYSADVQGGHDINDPAQLYHCGPTRRDLPT